jgi:hypothetical protein
MKQRSACRHCGRITSKRWRWPLSPLPRRPAPPHDGLCYLDRPWVRRARFLLHILPKEFHRIRHHGLLASATCKANIARARELIAVAVTDPPAEHDDADLDDHRPLCPCCGGSMIIVESFGRGGAPRGPPSPRSRGQDRDAMMPVTASLISRLPGKPRFRRRIAVAPPSPTARPLPSIRQKSPRRPPPQRQARHCARRSAADYIPHPSRRPVKSPKAADRPISPRGFLPGGLSDAGRQYR